MNKDSECVMFNRYRQPQYGGQFEVHNKMLTDHPPFQDLIRLEYEAALLVQSLNSTTFADEYGKVQPTAVSETVLIFDSEFNSLQETDGDVTEQSIVRELNDHGINSLVPYPCTYHRDTFHSGNASFESKLLMALAQEQIGKRYGVGRGGSTNHKRLYVTTHARCKRRKKKCYNSYIIK